MLAHPITKPMHSLVSAAIVLTLVGLCIPPLAFAGVVLNTIDQVAIVTDTIDDVDIHAWQEMQDRVLRKITAAGGVS